MADHVLAALPQDVFVFLSDWLAEQGDSVDYDQLKRRLLREFVATPEQRANKLLALSRQPLGDLRASTAFREMRALTRMPQGDGTTQTLDLLRVLWLQRLPSDVRRGITEFSELSDDELIKLADALQEADRGASSRSAMAATDAGAPQPPEEPDDEDVAAAAPSQPKRWPQTTQRRLPPRQPPRGLPRGRLLKACVSSTVSLATTRATAGCRARGQKTSEEAAPRGSLSRSTSVFHFR